jgi:predicted esterase
VVLSEMKAEVDGRVYEGLGHAVNRDEMDAFGALLRKLPASPAAQPNG